MEINVKVQTQNLKEKKYTLLIVLKLATTFAKSVFNPSKNMCLMKSSEATDLKTNSKLYLSFS